MSKPPGKKLVIVAWRDAECSMTEELTGDHVLYTVGWMRKKTERWVYISNEKAPSLWRGNTRIPTVCVLSIQRLSL